MIKKDGVGYKCFCDDFAPCEIYLGENKVAGYNTKEFTGKEISAQKTYNDRAELVMNGKTVCEASYFELTGESKQETEKESANLWYWGDIDASKTAFNAVLWNGSISGGACIYVKFFDGISGNSSSLINLEYDDGTTAGISTNLGLQSGYDYMLYNVPATKTLKSVVFKNYPSYKGVFTDIMLLAGNYTYSTLPEYEPYRAAMPSAARPSEIVPYLSAGEYKTTIGKNSYSFTLPKDLHGLGDVFDVLVFEAKSEKMWIKKLVDNDGLDSTKTKEENEAAKKTAAEYISVALSKNEQSNAAEVLMSAVERELSAEYPKMLFSCENISLKNGDCVLNVSGELKGLNGAYGDVLSYLYDEASNSFKYRHYEYAKKLVFDGTENFTEADGGFFYGISDKANGTLNGILCSHYKTEKSDTDYVCEKNMGIEFFCDKAENAAELQNIFKAQYDKGTPVTVLYKTRIIAIGDRTESDEGKNAEKVLKTLFPATELKTEANIMPNVTAYIKIMI